MAVEPKRGCGYRKVGGMYLAGGGPALPCGRLPLPLTVCPTCGEGVKQSRGWTWITPAKLFADTKCASADTEVTRLVDRVYVQATSSCRHCPLGEIDRLDKAGLLWIGKAHYPTPEHFIAEGIEQGLSRRIAAIPREFVLGETWVFLAHPSVIVDMFGYSGDANADGPVGVPAVFRVWRPDRIEKIVTESEAKNEVEMQKLRKRGITPVSVPDHDKDHQ